MSEAEARHRSASGALWFREAVRTFLDISVSGLIEGACQAAEQSGVRGTEDVQHTNTRIARLEEQAAAASRQLKTVLTREVYHAPELEAARAETDRQVAELFGLFMDRPTLFPEVYQTRVEEEPPHRVVCDYMAGMTDKFLLAKHAELGLGSC